LGGASIYILLCSDGSYYTGITRSVEERVSEHAQGLMPGYSFTRRPVKLVFSEHYERIVDAIAAPWSVLRGSCFARAPQDEVGGIEAGFQAYCSPTPGRCSFTSLQGS
jgi:putative endonuclease